MTFGILAGCLFQHGRKMPGCFVGQGGHRPQEIVLVEPGAVEPAGKLRDQVVIAEDHVGAAEVSEPCIGPAVVTDDGRAGRQFHDLHGGQVIQVLRFAGKTRDHPADLGDRTSIEVVIAQDEIDRLLDDFLDGAEVVAHVVAFRDVAADCHGVGPISDGGEEIVHAGRVNEIQVDVGQPSKSHRGLRSGRFASY